VSKWHSVVTECNINSSTQIIADQLEKIELNEDDQLISFDITLHKCTTARSNTQLHRITILWAVPKTTSRLCSVIVLMLTNGF